MDTAGSGKEIRTGRKWRSRTRSRSRDPHSKHGRDDEYKDIRHKRDKPTQERILPSRRCSSTSSSSSSDNRQVAESWPRPRPSSVLYHAKSRKRSRSHSHSGFGVIKEDVPTIRNKTPKQVKGMHPNKSLIWLSEHRGRVFPRPFTHGGICTPIWLGQSINGGTHEGGT